jgi:hypothetical protein
MLRYALARSAGDVVFRDLLAANVLVCGGYSAGPCVLAPGLRGPEPVDDADAVHRIYSAKPVWDGLAVLTGAFVPHCGVTRASRDGSDGPGGRPVPGPRESRTARCATGRPSSCRWFSRRLFGWL